MQQTKLHKQNMYTCKSIITREHSIKTQKMPFLREIIICQPLLKCKINPCCHKFYKRGQVILERKGKASTNISLPRILQISIHNIGKIRVYWQVGRKRWLDIKDQEDLIFDRKYNINFLLLG